MDSVGIHSVFSEPSEKFQRVFATDTNNVSATDEAPVSILEGI